MNKVTVSETVLIQASPEVVWDYTQDWTRRHEWDRSVVAAEIVSDQPRTVKVRGRGGVSFSVIYKQSERPRLTTVAISGFDSFWLRGGGGAWRYESDAGGTRWVQHNTLTLREGALGRFLRPVFGRVLHLTTRQLMSRAKRRIEALARQTP